MAEIDYTALTHSLSARRFLPQVFDTAEEAKAAALAIIGAKSVGIGGSATVRDMHLAEALQENGNQVYWHWLAAKEAKQAARDKALTADVYMCSSNALTTDGRLVNIDGTGNRAAGLIYGPHEVIVILGKNKIVGSLDEAIDRIKRDTCPQNARRLGLDTFMNDPQLAGVSPEEGERLLDDMLEAQRKWVPAGLLSPARP